MDSLTTLFAWLAFLAGMILLWRHMHRRTHARRRRKRVRFSNVVNVRTFTKD